MTTSLAALIAVLLVFVCPSAAPLGIVITVNLYLWRQRAAIRRQRRARRALARARAEERRQRGLLRAWRSLP